MLSLLFAPLQYAMAELNMVAPADKMHCQMNDESSAESSAGSVVETQQSASATHAECDCCSQCETSCGTCLHFTAVLFPVQFDSNQPVLSDVFDSVSDQATGIIPNSEFRPPRA